MAKKEKTVIVTDTFVNSLCEAIKHESKLPEVTKSEKAGHSMRDLEVNKNWKKRWKDFVKYDYDWDGTFFLELVLYKLKLIQKRYNSEAMANFMAEESLAPIQKSINECVELGEKILKDEYDTESSKYLKENTINGHYLYINNDNEEKEILFKAEDDEDLPLLSSMKKCVDKKKELEIQYPNKEINLAYYSEWINGCDKNTWHEIMKQEKKQEEKDTKKFFTLIAKNYMSWWD